MMNIYVLSAGFEIDYDYYWQQEPGAQQLPVQAEQWHKKHLSEGDAAFALVAGYTDGGWHIEFRNLVLPGIKDIRSRQIVLNICFSGLTTEQEVRALALAYLDFELLKRKSGSPLGRYCEELSKAYSKTDNGNYKYDFAAAKSWAQQAIKSYKQKLSDNEPTHKIVCKVNLQNREEAEIAVRRHIQAYKLQNTDGFRLLWKQLYENTELPADMILQCTKENQDWEEIPLPTAPRKPLPLPPSPSAPFKPVIIAVGILILCLIVCILGGILHSIGNRAATPPPNPTSAPQQKPTQPKQSKPEQSQPVQPQPVQPQPVQPQPVQPQPVQPQPVQPQPVQPQPVQPQPVQPQPVQPQPVQHII